MLMENKPQLSSLCVSVFLVLGTTATARGVFNKTAFLYDVETQNFTSHALSVDFGRGG